MSQVVSGTCSHASMLGRQLMFRIRDGMFLYACVECLSFGNDTVKANQIPSRSPWLITASFDNFFYKMAAVYDE